MGDLRGFIGFHSPPLTLHLSHQEYPEAGIGKPQNQTEKSIEPLAIDLISKSKQF
jgi:hypothetical protein